jgi:hypothetical protein
MSNGTNEVAIFTLIGYEMLTTNDKDGMPYRWRHVVFSGFNKAFREFFPGKDPKDELNRLQAEDLVLITLARGGAAFVPQPSLLHKASPADKAVADRVRAHLTDFLKAREEAAAAKAQKTADKPKKPGAVEKKAASLLAEGKIAEAMKVLGYG